MKGLMKRLSLLALSVVMVMSLAACGSDFDSPTGIADPTESAEFYTNRGSLGEIAINVYEGEIVLNLPAGVWKISYQVGGYWYHIAVNLESEQLVFIGILDRGLASDVIIQKGSSLLGDLEDGELSDAAGWLPAEGMEPVELFTSGESLYPGIPENMAHPKKPKVDVCDAPPLPEDYDGKLEYMDAYEAWEQKCGI